MKKTQTHFGCSSCCPESADDAWGSRSQLQEVEQIVDESHYRVRVQQCPACDQQFLAIFTEMLDWRGGNDDQHWLLYPLTQTEVADLLSQENPDMDAWVEPLDQKRRSLHKKFPPRADITGPYWSKGVYISWHC